jgi:hypothetical protein
MVLRHDSNQRAMAVCHASRQNRIVHEQGLRPDTNRVHLCTLAVDYSHRRWRRDGGAVTALSSHTAVEAQRSFQRHERTARPHHREKGAIQRLGLPLHYADDDIDAARAEMIEPSP